MTKRTMFHFTALHALNLTKWLKFMFLPSNGEDGLFSGSLFEARCPALSAAPLRFDLGAEEAGVEVGS